MEVKCMRLAKKKDWTFKDFDILDLLELAYGRNTLESVASSIAREKRKIPS